MILSKPKQAIIDADPIKKAFLQKEPYAFFGWGLNYPRQAEVIRKWIEVQPKITVLTGWKRTGKTQVAVYLLTCWLLSRLDKNWIGARTMGVKESIHWHKGALKDRVAIIGGKSLDHVENVLLPLYKSLIPGYMIKSNMTKNDKRLVMEDDSKALIRTYDQDLEMWKSGTAEIIHLDEEPPIGVMNECLDRTRTTAGKIFITVAIDDADVSWLPDACNNPIKYFGTDSFLHMKMGIEDVPIDIYPEEEKQNTYRKYDNTPFELAVRKGEFAYISGKWWSKFDPQLGVIEPFPIPDHWLKWRFIDAGMAAPAACAWVALHPAGDMFVYREYYKAGTTIDERCRDIIELSGNRRQRDGDIWIEHEQREHYIATYLDHAEFRGDPITGDSVDFVYVRAGLTVQPWSTMGQEARREVINRWLDIDHKKTHYINGKRGAPRLYIFSNCTNLIWEAQKKAVKREKSDKHGISERKVDNRDDHLTDCVESAAIELENWIGVSEKDF